MLAEELDLRRARFQETMDRFLPCAKQATVKESISTGSLPVAEGLPAIEVTESFHKLVLVKPAEELTTLDGVQGQREEGNHQIAGTVFTLGSLVL